MSATVATLFGRRQGPGTDGGNVGAMTDQQPVTRAPGRTAVDEAGHPLGAGGA
ncbi:hypothetical protein [Micromonospora violae]|uniref:hypothetical protein n=1 Tax=Micromonospora violae TaxID=1278207 RepID=UPI0013EF1FB1|nr:hypothetical protein [Micromonospora violae]